MLIKADMYAAGGIETAHGTGTITANSTTINDIGIEDPDVFYAYAHNSTGTYKTFYIYKKATENMIEQNICAYLDRTYAGVNPNNPITFNGKQVTIPTTGSAMVGASFEWETYKWS